MLGASSYLTHCYDCSFFKKKTLWFFILGQDSVDIEVSKMDEILGFPIEMQLPFHHIYDFCGIWLQ